MKTHVRRTYSRTACSSMVRSVKTIKLKTQNSALPLFIKLQIASGTLLNLGNGNYTVQGATHCAISRNQHSFVVRTVNHAGYLPEREVSWALCHSKGRTSVFRISVFLGDLSTRAINQLSSIEPTDDTPPPPPRHRHRDGTPHHHTTQRRQHQ